MIMNIMFFMTFSLEQFNPHSRHFIFSKKKLFKITITVFINRYITDFTKTVSASFARKFVVACSTNQISISICCPPFLIIFISLNLFTAFQTFVRTCAKDNFSLNCFFTLVISTNKTAKTLNCI